MLARFCLPQHHGEKAPVPSGLGNRILQECATLCVENAHKIITLIDDSSMLNETIGLLPWWYRVFYLHIASQHLIAAMLRPDVFAPTATESWNKAMSALRALEHLSPSVQRCIASFQAMWQKVVAIRSSNFSGGSRGSAPEAASDASYQHVFQHLGFDTDFLDFGVENMAWLGDVDWNPTINFS